MRIAMVNYVAGGHHVVYARDIVRALLHEGHQVVAVGPPEWAHAFSEGASGISIDLPMIAPGWRRRNSQFRDFVAQCFEACVAEAVDIVHLMYLDGFIEAVARVGLPRQMPVVATLHWYPFLGASLRVPRQWLKAWYSLKGLSWLDRHGMHLVVHSEMAARQLRLAGVANVTSLQYPYSGAMPRATAAVRLHVRDGLGLRDGDHLLLCFGGTRSDKGVDLAIASLARAGPHYRLLVAGAPHHFDHAALHSLASQHGVADRVILRLEHVPEQDIPGLFAAADAIVLPYRPVFTGQSGPLVMAAALGRPVIASDVPVLAETVQRFRLGSLFRTGDADDLARVLQAGLPRTAEASTAALASAASPDRFTTDMLGVYEQSHQAPKATTA